MQESDSGSVPGVSWMVWLILSGWLWAAPGAEEVAGKAADRIILDNGREVECEVMDLAGDTLTIRYPSGTSGAPELRRVPLASIESLSRAPFPGEAEAMAQAIASGDPGPLMPFWVKHMPWLKVRGTRGGELGLQYAELLTRNATQDRFVRALKVYEWVEQRDWDESRKERARVGKLRLMLRQGRIEEVRPQAEALLAGGGEARVLIELHHVMAETASARLAQLLEDHPRWMEEEEWIPKHAQWTEEALDGYLYPHLFHGGEADLASRGLWAAVQVSLLGEQKAQAEAWAGDLLRLYPATPESTAAAAWLREHHLHTGAESRPAPVAPSITENQSPEPAVSEQVNQEGDWLYPEEAMAVGRSTGSSDGGPRAELPEAANGTGSRRAEGKQSGQTAADRSGATETLVDQEDSPASSGEKGKEPGPRKRAQSGDASGRDGGGKKSAPPETKKKREPATRKAPEAKPVSGVRRFRDWPDGILCRAGTFEGEGRGIFNRDRGLTAGAGVRYALKETRTGSKV